MVWDDEVIYKEGASGVLPHAFLFHFNGISPIRSASITRFIEFWCQNNCRGLWSVTETKNTLMVAFNRVNDLVIFQLSEEYSRFALSNSIIQRPHHIV
jgi:hypothetical protein